MYRWSGGCTRSTRTGRSRSSERRGRINKGGCLAFFGIFPSIPRQRYTLSNQLSP